MIEPKPKTVLELFEGHPERWIKRGGALDETGDSCWGKFDRAVKFCLYGACKYIYDPTYKLEQRPKEITRLYNSINDSVVEWNDAPERTFEEVLAKVKELGI